jgi:hypothetical protein
LQNWFDARTWPMVWVAAFALWAAPSQAQTYNVVGLVQDEEHGEPIGQVQITYKSGTELGYSKSNGRFEITVNSHNAILVFHRHPYKDLELDLSDLSELIDIEVTMQTDVLELAGKQVEAKRAPVRDAGGAHSLEELESMQGMRIDLNDHLRQLPGVSGMNEFTNDISVWGSRTQDVTHYLGQTRIPSLRHLDIGFPGNQSVLNPRLLKSITVSDNLARGPLNQGNASALVYDLKEGDPNNITGDLVFGTVNRELNLTGYWGGRTFIASGRYLEPTFLANLGDHFFTEPKEARLRNGEPCKKNCADLQNPFTFHTMDGYLGSYSRDSTGAYSRHSVIGLNDYYRVEQDVSNDWTKSDPQTLVEGSQDGFMYAYEGFSPGESGDLQYAGSLLHRKREDAFRDTLPPSDDIATSPPWYFPSGNDKVDNLIGDADVEDYQANTSFQWNGNAKLFGANYGYGLDLEYLHQNRDYRDIGILLAHFDLPQDYALGTALLRLKWNTGEKRTLDAALGASVAYQGLLDGAGAGFRSPAPLASLRYTRPLIGTTLGYGEAAIRANTAMLPTGLNQIEAVTTSSAEAKVGVESGWGDELKLTSSVYTRWYQDPVLPQPEVFWNFEETHHSDYAYANGGNLTATWLPSHHFGINVNASVVQGDYHLKDIDQFLPWEANRSLDLVSNLRFLPRRDSLLSFILTYTANNGAPLYEYTGLYANPGRSDGHSTGFRTIGPDRDFATVSRQRTDLRINLDLKSQWRPLESMRFFFEADNIFADYDNSSLTWLGGANRRKRGWTRANENGDLVPVVTKGLGLYIMFGLEGRLLI